MRINASARRKSKDLSAFSNRAERELVNLLASHLAKYPAHVQDEKLAAMERAVAKASL